MNSSQPSRLCRKKSLASLGLVTLLASLLSSCYYDPYAFQAGGNGYRAYGQRQLPTTYQPTPARGRQPVAYSNNSQLGRYAPAPNYRQTQPVPVGSRQGVLNSVAQAPTATYQPGNPYTAPIAQRTQPRPVDNRWNSGNDWNTRQQGARVNARGAGNAWRNHTTPTPTVSQTWQGASPYPAAGTTYPSQAGYQQSQYPGVRVGAGASAFGVNAGVGGGTYTVQRGDNLSTIASTHGVSLNALRSLNNLVTDVIQPGQLLNIPR